MTTGSKKLSFYEDIAILPENLDGFIDFNELFGRGGPLEVEIGSGKGTFLVHQAQAHPERNYLGIEWANQYYKYAVDRLGRWEVKNAKMLRTDVATFLPEHIAPGSVSAFHIYYPDPWPKKRHWKRRFVSTVNVGNVLRCLVPEGRLQIVTDHPGYYRQMCEVLGSFIHRGLLETVDFEHPAGAEPGEIVGTNYERKYRKEGRGAYTFALKKTGQASKENE